MGQYMDLLLRPRSTDRMRSMTKQAAALDIDVTGMLHDPEDIEERRAAGIGTEQVDTVHGVVLEPASTGEVKKQVKQYREKADVLVVQGGDAAVNKQAVSDERVDILLNPSTGRRDPGVDHVVAGQAAENHVVIGLGFRQLLHSTGKKRSFQLRDIKEAVRLCTRFDAPILLGSNAQSIDEMRAPRDMQGIIAALGFDPVVGERSVTAVPGAIIERLEDVRSESFVRPGVSTE